MSSTWLSHRLPGSPSKSSRTQNAAGYRGWAAARTLCWVLGGVLSTGCDTHSAQVEAMSPDSGPYQAAERVVKRVSGADKRNGSDYRNKEATT